MSGSKSWDLSQTDLAGGGITLPMRRNVIELTEPRTLQRFHELLKNFSDMDDRALPQPVGAAGAESLSEFENLLASFDRLPKAEKKPFTTLLEIANYPRS